MNFLEGGSVNLSAGYLVGVGYTFVPDKWNKWQRAIEIGIMTPQYGLSENYSYLAR